MPSCCEVYSTKLKTSGGRVGSSMGWMSIGVAPSSGISTSAASVRGVTVGSGVYGLAVGVGVGVGSSVGASVGEASPPPSSAQPLAVRSTASRIAITFSIFFI